MNTRIKRLTREYYSTGQVASLCAVTPDTVLKWVKAGRLPSQRTPGGHYRIPRSALQNLLGERSARNGEHQTIKPRRPFQYCWEFNSESGEISAECNECIIYRVRVGRCYETIHFGDIPGHSQQFCRGSCEDCEYYHVVREQRLNVLVVTDKPKLRATIQADEVERNFNLSFAVCEYDCSMLVEKFRPDYAIVDCSLGTERAKEFAGHLHEDPRIPFVRVILAGTRDTFPRKCDREVFAFIEHPFNGKDLAALIDDIQRQAEVVEGG